MSLSKKPPLRPAPKISETDVEALIGKGGGVPAPAATAPGEKTGRKAAASGKRSLSVLPSGKVPVQLRLDPETIEEIDAMIKKRLVPVSRHVWLMEAIMEKLRGTAG